MSKVFLHMHDKGQVNWVNNYNEFDRIPVEGEYFALSSVSEWYEVELIVHTPFEEELHAEVYAVKVDHEKVKQMKLNTKPGVSF
jgi:hypothetical protein